MGNKPLHVGDLGKMTDSDYRRLAAERHADQQKKVDAIWTVEPWGSRLETEAGGKVLVEEPDTATTVLVASVKFLKENRELAKKFWQAHHELTDWILQTRLKRRGSCRLNCSLRRAPKCPASLSLGRGSA